MKPISFTMTTANLEEERFGHEVRLDMESLKGDARFQTTARSHQGRLKEMAHLSDVNLPNTGDKNVTMLIGGDPPDIIDKQLEKKKGNHGKPMAVKTPLGWTVHGPIAGDRVQVNFTRTDQERLNAQLERMYDEEFNEASADFEEDVSFEDRKAQEIMDRSVTLVNGHHQLKLPFRQETHDLPARLTLLKGKMQREPIFRSKDITVVEKYRAEGASRQVPDDKLANLKPIWHLPHHA